MLDRFDHDSYKNYADKAKPVVRRGRKATDLLFCERQPGRLRGGPGFFIHHPLGKNISKTKEGTEERGYSFQGKGTQEREPRKWNEEGTVTQKTK